MVKAANTPKSDNPGCISVLVLIEATPSPINGSPVCPRTAMSTVHMQAITVNPTTHGFRRCVASEIAPKTGIETTTRAEAIPFTNAYYVLECPRSATSHAAKYSVAMFIENTVFAKS